VTLDVNRSKHAGQRLALLFALQVEDWGKFGRIQSSRIQSIPPRLLDNRPADEIFLK
jgi:hypothetical protein